jgi:glutamyl-Q tRNA(Asp) synthetase
LQKSKKDSWAHNLASTNNQKTTTEYRGRFAPSPSGPLHFGSLVAAVASYCRAKSQHGKWLLRIEDLDPPRTQKYAIASIISTLEHHQLIWDEPIFYQSQQFDHYEAILEQLRQRNLTYPCQCPRRLIQTMEHGYDQRCRNQKISVSSPVAWRLKNQSTIQSYQDAVYGTITLSSKDAFEDFVLKRRDGYFAYQLAVVVDDIAQKITEIVRGYDIHDSTLKQFYLFDLLGAKIPTTAHLPLVMANQEQKLSKQNQALALDNAIPAQNLYNALRFLGQDPPSSLKKSKAETVLEWGVAQWNMARIPHNHKQV